MTYVLLKLIEAFVESNIAEDEDTFRIELSCFQIDLYAFKILLGLTRLLSWSEKSKSQW